MNFSGPKPTAGSTIRVLTDVSAAAAMLNVTGVDATSDGFVTAYPCGTRPPTSNLNAQTGQTVANLAVVPVDADNAVCIFVQPSVHIVVDLLGYYRDSSSFQLGESGQRILDTRATGPSVGYVGAKPVAGQVVELSPGNTVASDAAAVVLNLTATGASGVSYVTAWPCGSPRPLAPNLDLSLGETRANLVVTHAGTGNHICLFTQSGTDLVVDLVAWEPAGAALRPLGPARVVDTRTTSQTGYTGPTPTAGQVLTLNLSNLAGWPSDAANAVLNMTATESHGPGFVTAYHCSDGRPPTSNLNLQLGHNVANLVVVPAGTDQQLCIYTSASTELAIDVLAAE